HHVLLLSNYSTHLHRHHSLPTRRSSDLLAWWQGHFDPLVALLALITAGLLQILSNLANDYGDAVKGSDKPDRIAVIIGEVRKDRSEEHTSELQSRFDLVCRLLLEKKKNA